VARPLQKALEEGEGDIVITDIGTTFFTALKASVVFGLFLTGPFVIGELWKFVSPGLYEKERRWFVYSAPLSYALFAAGGVFFYFAVQPVMIEFFLDFGRTGNLPVPVKPMIDLGGWFTLWLGMALVMGLIFQLPLLMVGAQLTGLVDARTFSAYRRHFIVGSVIAAAFLTPTGDAVTLSITMVPILVLFEAGLLLCRMLGGGRKRESTE